MLLRFIICFLFFVPLKIFCQKSPSKLKTIPLRAHFESETYQGGMHSWDFCQSSNGFLYVANDLGVLEFDGNSWTKYIIPESTKIRTIVVDSKGVIYLGGQNQLGYLNKTLDGLEFVSLKEELNQMGLDISEVWKIFELNDKIYINTEDKLIAYSSKGFEKIDSPGFLINSFKIENRLFCQFYNLGLFEYISNEFIKVSGSINLPRLSAILNGTEGYYFFSETGDVFEYSNSFITHKKKLLESSIINDVIRLQNGDYAVGTENNGVLVLTPDLSLKFHFNNNRGITQRTVKAVYEDSFNNLWISVNNGIDYLKLCLPFGLINEELGVEGTGYDAHFFDGKFYLGTNNGVFQYQDSSSLSVEDPYSLMPGSSGQVYQFSQIDDELFVNHHRGAFEIDNNRLQQFHDLGSWTFLKTPNPDTILGGDYKGIKYFEKENNLWKPIGDVIGMTESSRILSFENDTILWMSHGYKGVYRLEFDRNLQLKNEIKHFDHRHGFPSNILITAYKIDDQMIFTSEEGVYNYDPESEHFSKNTFFNELLGTAHISELVPNGRNSIYYIQNNELGVIYEEKFGKYRKSTKVFNHINDYISNDLQNISVLDENNVLITAKEGFIAYDPTKKHSVKNDYSTIIKSVSFSMSQDSIYTNFPLSDKDLEIKKDQSIKFEYTSPYFDGFEDLKYSYRLTPLDKKWSNWSTLNEKSYDHLPFGNYTFEVKTSNIYGIESEVSNVNFKVLTPWYATWYARLGYFMLLLLSLSLFFIAQSKKHKAVTTIITEEKEKEIQVKNEEINKLYNDKLESEINLKNDQLTSITMQLIKSKEFLNDVQNKISAAIDKGDSKMALRRIMKTIDQELSDEDYWHKFAYHFDQVHGNYLEKLSQQNIKLSPRELKLAAFLRMNMSSKEIAKLLNITTRGVELARYRLRKKLKLNRDQNLVEYLINLDNKA